MALYLRVEVFARDCRSVRSWREPLVDVLAGQGVGDVVLRQGGEVDATPAQPLVHLVDLRAGGDEAIGQSLEALRQLLLVALVEGEDLVHRLQVDADAALVALLIDLPDLQLVGGHIGQHLRHRVLRLDVANAVVQQHSKLVGLLVPPDLLVPGRVFVLLLLERGAGLAHLEHHAMPGVVLLDSHPTTLQTVARSRGSASRAALAAVQRHLSMGSGSKP